MKNMNSLKAPSLQSLMDSDRASNDSQYTDYNIQLDLEEVRRYSYHLFTPTPAHSYLNLFPSD